MNSRVSAPGFIAEVFGHRQGGKGDAKTGTRRLVHLAEDHDGLVDNVLAGGTDFGFLHFHPQVGAFTGSFAHAGEHRVTAVLLGDTGDEFLNDDGLAEASPAEQAALATANERA